MSHWHYALRVADVDRCTCKAHWMQTVADADATDAQLIQLSAARRHNAAAARARRLNRAVTR